MFSGRVIVSLVALPIIFVISLIVYRSGAFGDDHSVDQPIAFNHQKHIQNNINCTICPQYYADYATAGLPGVEVCVKCHEDVIYLTPEKEKIQKYYRSGGEIPWRQMYSVPAYVFFSHKRHVTFGKIDCVECHGDVAKWTRPPTEPEINLDMQRCIECHQKMQEKTKMAVAYNCNRCHR